MTGHPYPVGERVFHTGQLWARALPGGTASVTAVHGPYPDGAYEYEVRTCAEFASCPGPDNPETAERRWASYATARAQANTPEGTHR